MGIMVTQPVGLTVGKCNDVTTDDVTEGINDVVASVVDMLKRELEVTVEEAVVGTDSVDVVIGVTDIEKKDGDVIT